jgi:hypothetical protein
LVGWNGLLSYRGKKINPLKYEQQQKHIIIIEVSSNLLSSDVWVPSLVPAHGQTHFFIFFSIFSFFLCCYCFVLFWVFWDNVLLCSPDLRQIWNLPASTSQVLEVLIYTTIPSSHAFLNF